MNTVVEHLALSRIGPVCENGRADIVEPRKTSIADEDLRILVAIEIREADVVAVAVVVRPPRHLAPVLGRVWSVRKRRVWLTLPVDYVWPTLIRKDQDVGALAPDATNGYVSTTTLIVPSFVGGDITIGINGTYFPDIELPDWPAGYTWNGSQQHGIQLNQLTLTPVPVPAAMLLGMLGLGAAGMKLRKYV